MDKELLNFTSGDERALEAVIDKYSYQLLRYCHNILCDYHEAQDAIQITFIKAYQKRTTFKRNMKLSPWLYKIAYTTCVDILRKRRDNDDISKYQKEVEDNRISEDILSALLKLNALDRAIVYGRVMEEKSYDELSEIHGKSAPALRKRYERARKRLADELKDDYPYYAHNAVSTVSDERG